MLEARSSQRYFPWRIFWDSYVYLFTYIYLVLSPYKVIVATGMTWIIIGIKEEIPNYTKSFQNTGTPETLKRLERG